MRYVRDHEARTRAHIVERASGRFRRDRLAAVGVTPLTPEPVHASSAEDLAFARRFEAAEISPSDFDHRAHLRLAYVYLVESEAAGAEQRMRRSLLAFLDAHDVPRSKYHATLTHAWILAVRHFMDRRGSACFAEFADHSQPLLDGKVMLTHYSADALFSETARAMVVEPDLEAIPGRL